MTKPHPLISLSMLLLGFMAAGCPAHTKLSKSDRQRVQKVYVGQERFLKYACFVGAFYAYPDMLYLSERAFDERVLIENPDGGPILPKGPTEILPMGTRVRIRDIQFATSSALAERKLRSPRFFTWVLLDRLDKPADKPYVWVLTQQFRNRGQFDEALDAVLVERDPRLAFEGRKPEVLAAIDRKIPVAGMRYDALTRARGRPDKVDRRTTGGVVQERWEYAPGRYVILRNDRVTRWEGFGQPAAGRPGP